jgi:DNA-binding MarR family transcriptional regulator
MSQDQVDVEAAAALAVAGELRVLIGTLSRRLRAEAHPGDFTASQVAVISRLGSGGPATLTTLARAEGMRPQSMGAIVSVLEAAGLVGGVPDPTDGRQTILSLTASAREMIDANRVAKEDWLFRAIRSNLTPEEQRDLAHSIELLNHLVNP